MSLMAMDDNNGDQASVSSDGGQHATARRWSTESESTLAGLVERLTDEALAEPSALPGWSRAHVVAHLARNADALVNLLTWARTGVETPMYPSRQARDEDIATTAARPPALLRADLATASARLAETMADLPDDAWTAQVRNGQGRTVSATEIPWMRAKEVWVHGVDLRAGLAFADLPADFSAALVDDVLELFAGRQQVPAATIVATDVDRRWGTGEQTVRGSVAAIAAWLTRSDASGLTGEVPQSPSWL
jgi:maleylpyruvate isomerase